MESAHAKEIMDMAVGYLFWRLRAWLWGLKWLTVMNVRRVEYAAGKFDETEIHHGYQHSRTKKATLRAALAMAIMMIAMMGVSTLGDLVATDPDMRRVSLEL